MRFFCRSIFCFLPIARRLCGWLAVLGMLFLGAGCGRLSSERRPAVAANVPGAAAVRFLGNVRVIGTGGRFVLVQAADPAVAAGLTDGQALVCRATGADTATLRVSRERRPPFVVADVVGGEPHVDDEVFVTPAGEPAANPVATPPAAPASPAPAASPPPFRANPLLPPAS